MIDALIEEFLQNFDDSRFPADFLDRYEILECLAANEQSETLLVKERNSGQLLVAKCYTDRSFHSHNSESDLLQRLRHEGLPSFVEEFENEGMLCVLRDYVEGVSLDRYTGENAITTKMALSICVQLCDELIYLHSQNPPIIHRDIKPQNIVMDRGGVPHLIDFGNSRFYREGSQTDTVCFGTRDFAAPEQYGFAQTDARTDIFALGTLLGWLLTGKTDVKAAAAKIESREIIRIVERCTSFAPEQRYPSAQKCKTDLLRVINQKRKKSRQWFMRIAACAVFFMLGFVLGRETNLKFDFLLPGSVQFTEPLIEQAVRLELGKNETDPILNDELLNVTSIYIFGNQAVIDSTAFQDMNQKMMANDSSIKNGGIKSLTDLVKLKNLRSVSIALQEISDPSPLRKLENLEMIELKHNPIERVDSLAGMVSLRELYLFDTRISDLSKLADCPNLGKLDVGKTRITSLEAFAGINNLTSLFANQTSFTTIQGIEQFSSLQTVALTTVLDGDLTPLLSLPQLKTAYLDESLRELAAKTLQQASFEIITP